MEAIETMAEYPKYKDSGVEWLGEIPEEWGVSKLGQTADVFTGSTPSRLEVDNFSENGIPWVKPDNLNGLLPIKDTQEKLSDKGKTYVQVIPENSVLVNGIGNIGDMGITGAEVATNQQIHAIIFNQKVLFSFGKYLILSLKSEMLKHANKVVVPILNRTQLRALLTPLPPKPTQQKIADFLDKKTEKIDRLFNINAQKVERLKEYRQAIIFHAVTKGLSSWDAARSESRCAPSQESVGAAPYREPQTRSLAAGCSAAKPGSNGGGSSRIMNLTEHRHAW